MDKRLDGDGPDIENGHVADASNGLAFAHEPVVASSNACWRVVAGGASSPWAIHYRWELCKHRLRAATGDGEPVAAAGYAADN